MKNIILIILLSSFVTGCLMKNPLPEEKTVQGLLEHFPSHVKSTQAWYGHHFMVASTPILPTDKIPETKLKQYVGQSVIIKGTWYAGEIWKPNEAEMNMSMPVNPHHTEVIRGDGLKADSIKLMNKKGE